MTPRAPLVAALIGVAALVPAAGSQVVVTAAVVSGVAAHRVDAGYGVERSSGPFLGVAATVRPLSRVELELAGSGGTLHADSPGALDRDLGEMDARLTAFVLPWLELRAELTRRVYGTQLARQAWTLLGAGAALRPAMIGGVVHATGRFTLLPSVQVGGLPAPSVAFRSEAGIEYHRGVLDAGTYYALERYDFPATNGVRRLEQLATLTVRVTLRLRPT